MATLTTTQTSVQSGPRQPDIAYIPDTSKYLARVKRNLDAGALETTLPPGFPSKLESDLAWDGNTVSENYSWAYTLNETELKEVEEALRYFQSLKKPLGFVGQDTFPLPTLHATLRAISREIHFGHGFKVVRGVPVKKYSREENIIIYTGIVSHIAPVRGRQDNVLAGKPADVVLVHVKNLTEEYSAGTIGSPTYTTEPQVFHTDSGGEIVTLFALSAAAEGGQSYLSSSWKVYNELAATRPDLIRTLSEPWAADNFGKAGEPYSLRPLLYHQPAEGTTPERLIIQYTRRTFTGYWGMPRSANIPPITEAQAEALDALHFTAEKYRISLDFQEGDIQLINNLSVFHARQGFTDSKEQRRHLLRLWLRDPEHAWVTPEPLKARWAAVYEGVTPENSVLPLEPVMKSNHHRIESKD